MLGHFSGECYSTSSLRIDSIHSVVLVEWRCKRINTYHLRPNICESESSQEYCCKFHKKERTMSQNSKISRRDFIKMAGVVAASGTLAACGVSATEAPLATEAPPVAATAAPTIAKGGKVRIAVGGWAEQNIKDFLAATEFTKNSGIDVEVVLRTDTKE